MKKRITLSLCALFVCASPVLAQDAPNIVLILSDDQGYTDYGFMGHPDIETPHLDRLASESALFRRGYVPTALCRPALMTLATGLYSHENRTTGNDPADTPANRAHAERAGEDIHELLISHIDETGALPQWLAEKGYVSHQSGKWWEGSFRRGGFTEGMTRGFPEPGGRHGDDGLMIGREGMEPVFDFIDRSVADKKPFFVWYAPFLPHTPHNPQARLLDKYKAEGRPDTVAKYYAMCEWFDETCGALLDHLDDSGIAENTLVIYVTDNGWMQTEKRGYGPRSKRSPYEGGTRTPILFRWPGRIPAADRPELCSSIDIVPTILAAAGAKGPHDFPGLNLLPQLESGDPIERDTLFGESFAHDIADIENPEASLLYRWVIRGHDKLLLTYDGAPGKMKYPPVSGEPQLFDLEDDPREEVNLAAKRPDLVEELGALLDEWYVPKERQAGKFVPAAPRENRKSRPKPKRASSARAGAGVPPNVLMICIDDLNDWTGFLGGHPDALTPHMDGLAERGRNFTNAHCAVPVCSASRVSVMSGVAATTHGSYELGPRYEGLPALADVPTIQGYFKDHGYVTLAGGKVLHHNFGGRLEGAIDRSLGRERSPRPRKPMSRPASWSGAWDWGAYPEEDAEMADFQLARRAAGALQEDFEKPFFLTVGFFRPHVPLFAPPRWFDLYDAETITLPDSPKSDLDDLPPNFLRINDYAVAPTHAEVVESGSQRSLTEAYLASVSFVDHCVGIVLDALDSSSHADNTLVVLWSDHGFHLGEKQHWAKRTLWEESTRVPLLFAGPGIEPGEDCAAPASLIDIYPTLVELCGLPENAHLEGLSLVPQLRDPAESRERPAITSSYFGNHAIRTRDWRLIAYGDGATELYDHRDDPGELRNLAGDPAYAETLEELSQWIPREAAPEFKKQSERDRVRAQ